MNDIINNAEVSIIEFYSDKIILSHKLNKIRKEKIQPVQIINNLNTLVSQEYKENVFLRTKISVLYSKVNRVLNCDYEELKKTYSIKKLFKKISENEIIYSLNRINSNINEYNFGFIKGIEDYLKLCEIIKITHKKIIELDEEIEKELSQRNVTFN